MRIKTKRLVLRFMKKGDEVSIFRILNNKKISRCLVSPPYPYKMIHARKWIAAALKENRKKIKTVISFAVECNGEYIGSAGLHNIQGHKGEIGYFISEHFWGKGFATEAVKAITDFGFKKLRLKRIEAKTYLFNKPSIKVLQKCGYKKEGCMKKAISKNGHLYDSFLFAKVG